MRSRRSLTDSSAPLPEDFALKYSILHVSDLHIADPLDTTDFLREGFFREYLSDLPSAFQHAGFDGGVDAVIATGDFVDRGRVQNFTHATSILRFLADLWSVPLDNVVTCIGNHDVIRDCEQAGDGGRARAGYQKFSREFANAAAKPIGGVAVAGAITGGLAFVSLDATRLDTTRGLPDRPGILSAAETDALIHWINTSTGDARWLALCSHFPADMVAAAVAPFADPAAPSDWYQKHIWEQATYLRERLVKVATTQVAWLSGDIHEDSAVLEEEKVAFCTTGRLGVTAHRSHGEARRQVTLIELNDSGEPNLWRAEFHARGTAIAQKGEWIARLVPWKRQSQGLQPTYPAPSADLNGPRHRRVALDGSVTQAPPRQTQRLLEPIDADYEKELIQQISEDGLYRFGRFETAMPNKVSLGWIGVDDLCTVNDQFEPAVRRMAGWVQTRVVGKFDPERIAIVGLDAWGSMLGIQIALKLDLSFVPVSSRSNRQFARLGERFEEDECIRRLGECKVIVVVADVVGTGGALSTVGKKIVSALGEEGKALVWYVVSMFCDKSQDRGDLLDFLEDHGSLCVNLRLPLCDVESLPSLDVLPPTMSFAE